MGREIFYASINEWFYRKKKDEIGFMKKNKIGDGPVKVFEDTSFLCCAQACLPSSSSAHSFASAAAGGGRGSEGEDERERQTEGAELDIHGGRLFCIWRACRGEMEAVVGEEEEASAPDGVCFPPGERDRSEERILLDMKREGEKLSDSSSCSFQFWMLAVEAFRTCFEGLERELLIWRGRENRDKVREREREREREYLDVRAVRVRHGGTWGE